MPVSLFGYFDGFKTDYNFWIINEAFYQSLTDEQRAVLDSSIAEAAAYNWDISFDADNDAKANIEASGNTTIIVPDEAFKQQMRDAMAPVYDYFYQKDASIEEWVNMVRDYQAKN